MDEEGVVVRNQFSLRLRHGGVVAVILTAIAVAATAVFVHVVPVHTSAGSVHVVTAAEPDAAPSTITIGDIRAQVGDPAHPQIDHDSTLRYRAPDLIGADVGTLPSSSQHVTHDAVDFRAANDPVRASSAAPPSLIALSINRT
jgi:hypothetical protein